MSPHIYFCITAWGFNLKRILKLQKKAIRVISLSKYNSHTDPLFKQLSILRVDHIFQCQCLKLYHKITNNKAPSFFMSMFTTNISIHGIATRQALNIYNPITRTIYAEKCVRHYIPQLITAFPDTVTSKLTTHSLQGFSNYMKNYFLLSYKTVCTKQNCYVCQNIESIHVRRPPVRKKECTLLYVFILSFIQDLCLLNRFRRN